jgi:putative FmdB family regulatory protein
MPKYEYKCQDCKKRFEIFLSYADYGKKKVNCPFCESENITRKIGKIRVKRSDHSRMAELADPGNLEGLDEDPRTLGRMMRQMSSELGEDMGPEFDEVVGRLEKGQNPEQIERELPDLADLSPEESFSGDDE